jgi:hypothetical protein
MVVVGKTQKFSYDGLMTAGVVLKELENKRLLIAPIQNLGNSYGDGKYKCLLNDKIYNCKQSIVIYRDCSHKGNYYAKYEEGDFYDWLEDNCCKRLEGYYEPRYNSLKYPSLDKYNDVANWWIDDINDLCKGLKYSEIYEAIMFGEKHTDIRKYILSRMPGSWWEFYDKIFCYRV